MTAPTKLDRRRNAFRPDLADKRLEDKVLSARFVDGVDRQVREPSVPLRKVPGVALGVENELLLGDIVSVFDDVGGWAWAQRKHDGYVGYLPASALSETIVAPTHRVKVPSTFIYAEPNIKLPPIALIGLNAQLHVSHRTDDDRFVALTGGGFVIGRHVAPVDAFARDFVEVAEQLIHTPYMWGGRTRRGLDCTGLIQIAMEAAGLACPRDSDMQAAEIGETVLVPFDLLSDVQGLNRGDLVYWPGHGGIMIDSVMLLHANGYHMATVIEPLTQVARRIKKSGGGTSATGPEISTIRRPPSMGLGGAQG